MRIVEDFKCFTVGGGVRKKIAMFLLNPCFRSVCLFRLSICFYRMRSVFTGPFEGIPGCGHWWQWKIRVDENGKA